MSKAFTKEDDGRNEEELLPPRPREPLPVTPRGLHALRQERRALLDAGQGSTRRARMLAAVLETVVERAPALQHGGVGFGCVVTIEHEDGSERTYEIVGPDEGAPEQGRVSVASPLARALLGHVPGDVVTLALPRGEEEVTVLRAALPDQNAVGDP